jgi:hypothetical protein
LSVLEDGIRKATSDLNFTRQRDRDIGFYVRRRATLLAGQNAGWDADRLAQALTAERAAVAAYISKKLTALVTGPDPVTPGHLDLAAQASTRAGTGLLAPALSAGYHNTYTTFRATWIWQIVWRAMAIHGTDLWQPGTTPGLQTAALDELVDRRLHAVERMTCTVNADAAVETRMWTSVTSVTGPWNDGKSVRAIEYPTLPMGPFAQVLASMLNAGWQFSGSSGTHLSYHPAAPALPVRMAPGIAASWSPMSTRGGTIWILYVPGKAAPADVMTKMFQIPRPDFLDRSWLYCDLAGSALLIEALSVGLSRRQQAAAFDAVMNKPGYVSLGPVVRFDGKNDLDTLMCDGNDDAYFENTQVDLADLQVGDFVVFWNSRIYDLLLTGAWGNEFSLIMNVDTDPASGQVRTGAGGPAILLAGHGLDISPYSAMAADLATSLKTALDRSRQRITDALDGDSTLTAVDGQFVKWSPYEDFTAPGAWWLKIGQHTWQDDWAYPTKVAAVTGIPRAVADDPAAGAGYHHPPDPDAVYFPLWEPRMTRFYSERDAWNGYLHTRRDDPAYRPPQALAEVQADGTLAAGLFYRGSAAKIPIVRPRVRK